MTDDEIRALVRKAVARHLGGAATPPPAARPAPVPTLPIAFGRYALSRDADETACIIEPAVRCDHCGYCQSHGH